MDADDHGKSSENTEEGFKRTVSNISSHMADSTKSKSDWYVEVDRRISFLEWGMIATGIFVNPVIGIFIIVFGVKTCLAKQKGDRTKALKCKAMVLGLGQWSYRITITFTCIVGICLLMQKYERFGNAD